MQKQDTESIKNISDTEFTKFIKQSYQCKSRFNLSFIHQNSQIEHDEYSKYFTNEFEYDSVL